MLPRRLGTPYKSTSTLCVLAVVLRALVMSTASMDLVPRAPALTGTFVVAFLSVGRQNAIASSLQRETGSSRRGPILLCEGRNVATQASRAQPTAVVSGKDSIFRRVNSNSFNAVSTWASIDGHVPRKGGASLAGDVDKWEIGNALSIDKAAVILLRGGSTREVAPEPEGQERVKAGITGVVRTLKIQLSTTKISSYVDARGEVTAQSDWTVGRLKEEVEKKFPGKIPASLQRLFKGTRLLASRMTLEEASEGTEGPLCLLLDNAPPIDASRFDPETAVPSRRDGQVEAFSACLAAQAALQESLLGFMRGASDQDDPELTRSVRMKADFENTQALLRRTLEERPDTSVEQQQQAFGVLHEALRPLAHSLDVNWLQSAQYALFAYICAQFGARGALRRALTFMLIPLIFLAQTRSARVGLKLARNLAAEIPVLTQLFLGLLQAPGQVILSLDAAAYTRDLYGSEGPTYDEGFLDLEGELDMEGVTDDDESYD